MRIYILGNKSFNNEIPSIMIKVSSILKKSKISVFSNIKELGEISVSDQEIMKIENNGEILLDKIDAFIIDGSLPNHEAGYIIANALFRKKNVLYLLPTQKQLDSSLAQLVKRKEFTPYFFTRHFTPQVLMRHVTDFLRLLSIETKDYVAPTIKFTLRITPKIDKYLTWKSQKTNAKKADYLRELIEDQMNKDKTFK